MQNYIKVNPGFDRTTKVLRESHLRKLFLQYLCVLILMSVGWRIAWADILSVPSNYATIQQAIDAATSGDTVLVAPGAYVENINFLGKAITVQSQSGPEITTITGSFDEAIVRFSSGEGIDSKLEGFTLQFGVGGGIVIYSSSPTVSNNRITNASACNGWGIRVNYGSPIIKGNLIKHKSPTTCEWGFGNGIELYFTSTPEILDNSISDNRGAGMYLFAAGTPLIRNNIINGNMGSGIEMGNSSNPVIVQNLIYGNRGSGIYWLVPSGSTGPLLINNTIAENIGPGIYADGYDANVRLVNNIITGPIGQSAIFCGDFHDTDTPIFQFNDVFNPGDNAFDGNCAYPNGLNGNISVDPLFEDTQNTEFCLGTGSPVIDAGDNSQSDLTDTDFAGGIRVRDGNGDGSEIVDMGAYEHDTSSAGVLTFSSTNYVATETTNSFLITVTRHCGISGEVTVDYTIIDGTANAGSDYQSTSGTLTLHNGEPTTSFSIPIISDAQVEGDETVLLSLNNITGGATLGRYSSASLIIRDPSTIYFSAAAYSTNETDRSKVIEVTRDNSQGEVSIEYSTSDGTAEAGLDYTAVSGTLAFVSGQTTTSFTVPILADSEQEVEETVQLNLRNPLNGAVLGSPTSAELTILNADSTIHFSAATYTASEAEGSKIIEVIRDNSLGEVTVDYSTSNGTAEAGLDYTAVSGTLTFAPGQVTATFNIPILQDPEKEVDETILLNLSNPRHGAILGLPASAELTISNADILTRNYFPLTPGIKWQYLANGSSHLLFEVPFESVSINKVKTRTVKTGIYGRKYYYSNDSQGIRLHRLYFPKIRIYGHFKRLSLTASPPVLLAAENAEAGQTFYSEGNLREVIPDIGSGLARYTATYTVLGDDTITVPAGTGNVIKLQGSIIVNGQTLVSQTLYLAKNVGIVKQEENSFGVVFTSELIKTNTSVHDLAITAIIPPYQVILSAKKPEITKTVKVILQNRSPLLETITDSEMLGQFVDLNVESLGLCPEPTVKLLTEKLQKRMPINLKPKQTVSVDFAVTFNCANDPEANTSKNPGHQDYRYTATVNGSVLSGYADIHEEDDVCPRSVTPPYVIDNYPDRKIKDRGCGMKKPDKTFGADVVTDLIGP